MSESSDGLFCLFVVVGGGGEAFFLCECVLWGNLGRGLPRNSYRFSLFVITYFIHRRFHFFHNQLVFILIIFSLLCSLITNNIVF